MVDCFDNFDDRPIWVTGGMGFIGSHLVQHLLKSESVCNIDSLTYAASQNTVKLFASKPNHLFINSSILDSRRIRAELRNTQPKIVYHLAAESHVDRSIQGPMRTVETNVLGTQALLSEVTDYWRELPSKHRQSFRFIHVSTDEVFGQLREKDAPFTEQSAYSPRSCYSASKAASDHLVLAQFATHGLPVILTHCSNNFGYRQHPEKFIPTVIRNAVANETIPIYGTGLNQRDWISVEDHVQGLLAAMELGEIGERYLFGSEAEISNIDLARSIASILNQLVPREDEKSYCRLIAHVPDRPGHDFRYAVDCKKAHNELDWTPNHNVYDRLEDLVSWYLRNPNWHTLSAI